MTILGLNKLVPSWARPMLKVGELGAFGDGVLGELTGEEEVEVTRTILEKRVCFLL